MQEKHIKRIHRSAGLIIIQVLSGFIITIGSFFVLRKHGTQEQEESK